MSSLFHSLNILSSIFHTKSIEFDGVTETLANTTSQAIGVANAHSAIVWLKPLWGSQGYPFVIRNYNVDINNIIQIVWASNKFEVWLYNSSGTLFKKYVTVPTYYSGPIYAVGYSWDGTTLTLYVNGASVSVTKPTDLSGTQTDSNRRIWIGSNVGANNWYGGQVLKADIWDIALPANAFSALYDSGNGYKNDTRNALGNYTQTANLKHQWALGKDVGSNIGYDYVSSGQINLSANSVNIADIDIVDAGYFGGHSTLTTGLLNVWKFGENANDIIGGNNGTIVGATLADAKSWKGYSFNGTNNYITISSLSASVKSISFWAKKSATGAYGRVMGATGGTYYLVQLYNDGINYTRILSGQTLSFAQTDDTNRHHYVITADGITAKIYVDGVLKLSQASTGNFANMDQIGRYTTTNNSVNLWRGLIDEIVTWSKVLTDGGVSVGSIASGEIADLYNGLFY